MIIFAYFKNNRQYFTTYSLLQVSIDVVGWYSKDFIIGNQNQSILVTEYKGNF